MDAKAVNEIRGLEERLAAARETARAAFLQTINENLAQLEAIGFHYELAQNGAAPSVKRGRPRKEVQSGQAEKVVA